MARIRTIKPEFPHSESVGRLSRDARLLFIQLWTIADDSGKARAASRMLASLLYPFDTDAGDLIEGWLVELEAEGMIRRYAVEGTTYLDIPKWQSHQRVDKPSASRLPQFREEYRKPLGSLAPDLGPRTLDLEGKANALPLSETSSDAKPKKKNSYPPDLEEFWSIYPTDSLMSKKEAAAQWSRLSAEDKLLALKAVPAFKAYCAKNPDYRPLHACRFLSQRRFEGFAETANGTMPTVDFSQLTEKYGWKPGKPATQ